MRGGCRPWTRSSRKPVACLRKPQFVAFSTQVPVTSTPWVGVRGDAPASQEKKDSG
jgi:hypothetical protein